MILAFLAGTKSASSVPFHFIKNINSPVVSEAPIIFSASKPLSKPTLLPPLFGCLIFETLSLFRFSAFFLFFSSSSESSSLRFFDFLLSSSLPFPDSLVSSSTSLEGELALLFLLASFFFDSSPESAEEERLLAGGFFFVSETSEFKDSPEFLRLLDEVLSAFYKLISNFMLFRK